jgi:hypothetical protein
VKDEIMTLMKTMIEGREKDLESKRSLLELDASNKMGQLDLKSKENSIEDYYIGIKRDMLNTDVEKRKQELREIAFRDESRDKERDISLSKQSSELWVEHNRTLMEKDKIELEKDRQKLNERYLTNKDREITEKSNRLVKKNKLLKQEERQVRRTLGEAENELDQTNKEYSSLKREERDTEERLEYLRKEHTESIKRLREARRKE